MWQEVTLHDNKSVRAACHQYTFYIKMNKWTPLTWISCDMPTSPACLLPSTLNENLQMLWLTQATVSAYVHVLVTVFDLDWCQAPKQGGLSPLLEQFKMYSWHGSNWQLVTHLQPSDRIMIQRGWINIRTTGKQKYEQWMRKNSNHARSMYCCCCLVKQLTN